jgi:hypothetical protein
MYVAHPTSILYVALIRWLSGAANVVLKNAMRNCPPAELGAHNVVRYTHPQRLLLRGLGDNVGEGGSGSA